MPVVCKSPKRNNWVGTTLIIKVDDDIPIYLQLTYFLRRLCNCRSNLESDVSWAKVKDFSLKPPGYDILYFLMLMNNWQPFSKLVRGMAFMSYLCFFCLCWITCQSIPTFTQA